MRNIVQNIADDFFKILRFDKNDWYSYWKKMILDNFYKA